MTDPSTSRDKAPEVAMPKPHWAPGYTGWLPEGAYCHDQLRTALAERDAARREAEEFRGAAAGVIGRLQVAIAERDALRQELEALRAREPLSTRETLTDERIDRIADLVIRGFPDGIRGFCKTWGWLQFARALADILATPASAGPAETQGWRLVPVELEGEMLFENWRAINGALSHDHESLRNAWRRTLAVAPPGASPQPALAREGRVQRLQAAIEGECGGLAIDTIHALAILLYVDGDDTAREGPRGEYLTDADDERAVARLIDRSEVVSAPNAALKVTVSRLTDAGRAAITSRVDSIPGPTRGEA